MKWLSVLLFPTVKVSRLKMPYFVNVCVCVEVSCFHVSMFAYVYVLRIICVGVRDRETHLKSVAALVCFCTNAHVVCAGLWPASTCGCAEGSRSQDNDWHVCFCESFIVRAPRRAFTQHKLSDVMSKKSSVTGCASWFTRQTWRWGLLRDCHIPPFMA